MTRALPLNRLGTQPTVEAISESGQLATTSTNLGIGGVYNSAWLDVSAYGTLRLQSLANVASAVGGVQIDWSMNGVAVHASEAAASALAATQYDSGAINVRMQYVRVTYTNGAGAQASFLLTLMGYAGTGGGGGGGGGGVPISSSAAKDAGNSTDTALTGSGGLTPSFTGATRDVSSYPAVMVHGWYTKAVDTDGLRISVYLIWSETATPLVDGWSRWEVVEILPGQPLAPTVEGGFSIGRNRKGKYVTAYVLNNSVDANAALHINTYLLGAPIEEWDTTRTDGPGVVLTVALGDNAVHTQGLKIGQRYRVSVIGGAGICIRTDGLTVTTANEPWYDGQKFEFVAGRATNAFQAIKRTAGTANATVIIAQLDNGA